MQSQRFFIGNLPHGITEKDVRNAFKDYGDITAIVVKEKENLVDPGNVKRLAFVTLNLFDGDADFCLRKLNSKPINGEYIRVSVAKESFLERLNREREENARANGSAKPRSSVSTEPVRDFQPPTKSKRFFDSKEDYNENAFENRTDDMQIAKKNASNSMWNAKPERFFIGNLPSGITEKDLNKSFKDYGDVTGIVLKQKENLVDPGNVKTLAFVTVNLFDGDVDFCLKKLNSKPINGEYVRVSVAKESFLERLNREREDNIKGSAKTDETIYKAPEREPEAPNKSKKYFNTEEDDNENDDGDVLITKKKASRSMQNGKIVIEGTNSAPLHVIGKQKEVKQLSEKSFDSDKKRKESVTKKKNQYQLQKSLIQKSLSSVDASKTKKIIFDEENNDDTPSKANPLFQDSDEENDSFANDFAVKSEYEGSHGAELMKLQSKMNLDPRFKIDHKFVEKTKSEPLQNENSERDWQYGILEQVVGNKLSSVTHPKGHEKKKLKMLRYDPSKGNDDEFLIKRSDVKQMEVEEENAAAVSVEKNIVSKEVFYMVSDSLTNSLRTRGDGFSLLSMFGTAPDEDGKTSDMQPKEKILISKNDKNVTLNPFTYDSSESENEQDGIPSKTTENVSKIVENSKGSSKTQTKLFVESFFIPRNDMRLKEGKLFFRSNARSGQTENYDEIKDKLKTIINTKIKKTKRQFKGAITKKSIRGR